jgi:hypothetical protein
MAGHVARIGEKTNVYKVLRKTQKNRPLGRPRSRCEYENIY